MDLFADRKYPVEFLLSEDGAPCSLLGNEPDGNPDDYRAKDILAFYVLPCKLTRDQVMSTHGHDPYLPEQWDKYDPKTSFWLATSPNWTTIHEIPDGLRVVFARANGKYGLDDPILHPQLLCHRFEWLACISRYREEWKWLWWVPTPNDADLIKSAFHTDIRVLSPIAAKQLRAMLDLHSAYVFEVLKRRPDATLLSSLMFKANQCLERLCSFGMNFGGILRGVGDFQRALLCGRAVAYYRDVIYERMHPKTSRELNTQYPVDSSLMGGFTHDPELVAAFHRSGVPVVWVRPSFAINTEDTRVHIGACRFLTFVDKLVVQEEYRPFGARETPFPKIYEGPPGTELQSRILRVGVRTFDMREPSKIVYDNMLKRQSEREKQKVTESAESIQEVTIYSLPPMAETSTTSTMHSPSNSLPALTNAASYPLPNPFALQPPEIPVWASAAAAAVIPSNFFANTFISSYLPHPDLLLNAPDKHRATYFATWVAVRAVQLHGLSIKVDMGKMTTQNWRNYLLAILDCIPKSSTGVSSPSNEIQPAPSLRPSASASVASAPAATSASRSHSSSSAPTSVALSTSSFTHSVVHASGHGSSTTLPRKPATASSNNLTLPGLPVKPSSSPSPNPHSPWSSSKTAACPSHRRPGRAVPMSAIGSTSTPRNPMKRPADDVSAESSKKAKSGEGSTWLAALRKQAQQLTELSWYGKPLAIDSHEAIHQSFQPDIMAEIVWELCESTWHLELLMLDQRKASKSWGVVDSDGSPVVAEGEREEKGDGGLDEGAKQYLEREMAVRRVFAQDPNAQLVNMFPTEIPNRDFGVAAWEWNRRWPALKQLHSLMLDWDDCPDFVREAPLDCSKKSVERLEFILAHYFCSAYAKTFGRKPVVPCRLPYRSRTREIPVSSSTPSSA